MGKITEVLYEEVSPEICTIREAAEYYYHYNLLGSHDLFTDDYEKYEERQIKIRNQVIGNMMKDSDILHPKLNTSIFGVSTLKKKAVLVVDI